MKILKQILSLSCAVLCLSCLPCESASRKQALEPHLATIWERWGELPKQYQSEHCARFEEYLELYSSSNGEKWNHEFDILMKEFGSEFQPLCADVLEAMKVAEAYEETFPDPDNRLPAIADALFSEIPTNSIAFIHCDIFETILLIEQQVKGRRKDVIIINSSRIMDKFYVANIQKRYSILNQLDMPKIDEQIWNNAKEQKLLNNPDYQAVKIDNGKVFGGGIALMDKLSLDMVEVIAKEFPDKTSIFLPELRRGAVSSIWGDLQFRGLFFSICPQEIVLPEIEIDPWVKLIDAAAPSGEKLHIGMANSIGECLAATCFIFDEQGNHEISLRLHGEVWQPRMKKISLVRSQDIKIDSNGKMRKIKK